MNIGLIAINARMVICAIALFLPYILVVATGERLDSFSAYFYTRIGPIFVGILSLVCYLIFTMPKWIPAAVLLLGVIMFPCKEYTTIHNICAVLFFIASASAIIFERRESWMGYLMLILAPIALWDLFVCEVLLVAVISTYNIRKLADIKRILIKKQNQKPSI